LVPLFINISFFDILDIVLVAFLLYKVYMLIKGSIAMNIFVGIAVIYVIWLAVRALKMQMLSAILGQVMGVGAIALIIVFQQEVRRFLLLIGSKYFTENYRLRFKKLFSLKFKPAQLLNTKSIIVAVESMSKKKTGALIVITKKMSLDNYSHIGDVLDAHISSRILESVFSKDSPLHDGAVIIFNNKIQSARCILPVSDRIDLPPHFGTRHRAALGMTEATDSFIIVVSEETGSISYAVNGALQYDITIQQLSETLEKEFNS
jgi:diadenylate cyclase